MCAGAGDIFGGEKVCLERRCVVEKEGRARWRAKRPRFKAKSLRPCVAADWAEGLLRRCDAVTLPLATRYYEY